MSPQELGSVFSPPARGHTDRMEWFALHRESTVWHPEDDTKEPCTITSYQATLAARAMDRTRPLDAYEQTQLKRLWVLDRLPDGSISSRRRPTTSDGMDWMGMRNACSLVRRSVQLHFPCERLNPVRITPTRTPALCCLGDMCVPCGRTWELLGQAWHTQSACSVMASWVILAVQRWAEEQDNSRGPTPWTHPVHRCGGGGNGTVLQDFQLIKALVVD